MKNKITERRRISRRRRFTEGAAHHIYQRTVGGFNLFYDIEDYLVYFTIFSTSARKYHVTVLGLCLMFDHVHMLLQSDTRLQMSEFVRQVTSMFAREQNTDVGRKGNLFQARFGSASKRGLKMFRTSVAYLFNNPVEKQLCSRAEEYIWNFLAYAVSEHPFSSPVIKKNISQALRHALKEVKTARDEERHLRYGQLTRMFGKLNGPERMQLMDYIITLYNPIEYEELIKCYGSYKDMLIAVNSNTGSEYDIKEERSRFSDMEYISMLNILRDVEGIKSARKVTGYEYDEKIRLLYILKSHLSSPESQLRKFLHL